MKKRFTPSAVIDMYDDWSERYDNEFEYIKRWCGPQFVHQTLSDTFNIHARRVRVLDIGIGTGMLSAQFRDANPTCHITGIDISGGMLEKCRDKDIADRLIKRDFQKKGLPFPDKHFDVAVSSGVFELLDKPDKVIQEMGRVLRPDGVFGFTVFSDAPKPYACHRHPDELIENALDEANMDVKDVTRFWAFNHFGNDIHYNLYSGTKRTP